jgi:nicotinate-nucleotide adenylyltransferase
VADSATVTGVDQAAAAVASTPAAARNRLPQPLRIGIFGGTFDPIHFGHLMIAEECRFALDLDQVLFVPAGDPPHKKGLPITPSADRVAMIERAIAGNSAFAMSRIDVDRAGPSFTVDLLATLRAELGSDVALWFVMGADSLADLLAWRDPARIIELARIAATNRPDAPMPDPRGFEDRLPGAIDRIDVVDVPALQIASSDLRRRVAAGQPIRYQVPDSVWDYVVARGLYRGTERRRRAHR